MDSKNDLKVFWLTFNNEIKELRHMLMIDTHTGTHTDANAATAISATDCTIDFVVIRKRLVVLQKYATESCLLMPPYDVRRTQEEIEKLNKEMREKEQILKPKKKFAFGSSRSKCSSSSAVSGVDSGASDSNSSSSCSSSSTVCALATATVVIPGSYLIANRSNDVIVIPRKGISSSSSPSSGGNTVKTQLLIKNLLDCTVSYQDTLGSVRIENCSGCTIYLSPCHTSVYLEQCSKCTIHIACHQLRIHKSSDSHLYVRCNSHPIIEDCVGLMFAAYCIRYQHIDDDFKDTNLQAAANWDNIVDFRWHRTTPSPNWTINTAALVLPTGDTYGWSHI